MLAVFETWLVPSVSSSFVTIYRFRIVRDGSQSVRKHGCNLYAGDTLSIVQIEVDLLNVAAVLLLDLDMYVLAVDRPPSNSLQDESFISSINDFYIDREVVILGDFNLPSLDWIEEYVIGGYVPPRDMVFFDCFGLLDLNQWVKEGTFLDSNNIRFSVHDRVGQNRRCVCAGTFP